MGSNIVAPTLTTPHGPRVFCLFVAVGPSGAHAQPGNGVCRLALRENRLIGFSTDNIFPDKPLPRRDQPMDRFEQLRGAKWLAEELRRSCVHELPLAPVAVWVGRDHDQGNCFSSFRPLQFHDYGQAIHLGHQKIHNAQLWLFTPGGFNGLPAGARAYHLEARMFQMMLVEPLHQRIIIRK